MKLITLFLTCADDKEAKTISNELLTKKLAACVRITNVKSDFLWKAKQEHADETLLIIDTIEEKFDEIEDLVRGIHRYQTFVLTAYPVAKSSNGVEDWVKEVLNVAD